VKIVIVGCGRVGASAAELWDQAGHEVVILDIVTRAFERLPSTFGGTAIRGDGTDEDVLRRAGAEGANIFLSMTEGDNRNIMAAQVAAEALGIERVIAKINDPVRAKAYAEIGIATLCRTGLMLDAVNAQLGMPPSGLPGMQASTGHEHPGGGHEHHGADPSASRPAAPEAGGPIDPAGDPTSSVAPGDTTLLGA
jgi:trk/ktr system potassium uptake protein